LQPIKRFQKKLRILPVLGACIVLGAIFNTHHTRNMASHVKGLHTAQGLVGAGKTAVRVAPSCAGRENGFMVFQTPSILVLAGAAARLTLKID
jgi:hypothetical protein